jgi:flagellar operon protein
VSSGPILYPNITSLPGQSGVGQADRPERRRPDGAPSEFDQVFDKAISGNSGDKGQASDLNQVRSPLKFSSHASQRLKERKIDLDPTTMAKLNEAIDKADAKGVQDTLVLTKDAALIVNVKNRTVVTAMDKNNLTGNVFTNIDGAVLI